jgi:hypothetical protein
MTAHEVSSHDDSIPKIVIFINLIFSAKLAKTKESHISFDHFSPPDKRPV